MDKVSVIIPAYNKGLKTVRAVESVIEQTYNNLEIIVVDDFGSDDLYTLLGSYMGMIRYTRHGINCGASSARNTGIDMARGDYVAFLDCDDYYEPNKIEKSVKYLELYNCKFVHTAAYKIGGEVWYYDGGNPTDLLSRKIYYPKMGNLLFKNYICNSTVVVKREHLDRVGYFNEDLFVAADWDMWLRLSEIEMVDFDKKYMVEHKEYMGYLNMPLTWYSE